VTLIVSLGQEDQFEYCVSVPELSRLSIKV
jgi:hypothetical protein